MTPDQGLTGYRVPKDIEFRDALPETLIGKVLRRALQEEERQQDGRRLVTILLDWDLGEGLRVRSLDLGHAEALFALVRGRTAIGCVRGCRGSPPRRGPTTRGRSSRSSRDSETDAEANGIWSWTVRSSAPWGCA